MLDFIIEFVAEVVVEILYFVLEPVFGKIVGAFRSFRKKWKGRRYTLLDRKR